MIKRKKAQEEMIGFVLIIVLVSVIVLVFIAISIKKVKETGQNKEIESFLYSSLLYTTSCYKSQGLAYDLKGLIKSCYNNENCLNGEGSCEILNTAIKKLIENGWKIGEDSSEKAYAFKIYQGNKAIIELKEGKETGSKKGAEIPVYVEGNNLYVRMEVFY